MASGYGVDKPDKGNHPGRQVHRQVFDNSIVDSGGIPTKRQYESRYDEGGEFVSQGYTDHGPASQHETRRGTWSDATSYELKMGLDN
jgi:hypothetical protein